MAFNPLKKIKENTLSTERKISLLLNNQARLLREMNRSKLVTCLKDVEFSVRSQWGEDGILLWLVDKLSGKIPQTFIEFGVEDYQESNTRTLCEVDNWRGGVIDSSENKIQRLRKEKFYWRHQLEAQAGFITTENINHLIDNLNLGKDIGVLSIDIDGNDYWVWDSINVIDPAIVVIEFNAVFGDMKSLTIPYNEKFSRKQEHYSNLYFGASLGAFVSLGKAKGYTLIGTTSTGLNAFFIRDDLKSFVISEEFRVEVFPSLFRESRGRNGNLSYISGLERIREISNKEVFDLSLGEMTLISEITETLHSEEWQRQEKRVI